MLITIGRKIKKEFNGVVYAFSDISRDIPRTKLIVFNKEESGRKAIEEI